MIMKIKKTRIERLPGHSLVLHHSISFRFGQEAPASFASLITSRVLVLVPMPQVALHSPHADQSPTLQSTEDQQFSKYMMMKIKKGKKSKNGQATVHLPHSFQSSTLQSTGNINQRANIFYDSNSDCITFSSNYGLWCSYFEYDAFGDEDDDDLHNTWFPFLIGLRLPTAGQTAARLTSTMAWFLRPLSNVPI